MTTEDRIAEIERLMEPLETELRQLRMLRQDETLDEIKAFKPGQIIEWQSGGVTAVKRQGIVLKAYLWSDEAAVYTVRSLRKDGRSGAEFTVQPSNKPKLADAAK